MRRPKLILPLVLMALLPSTQLLADPRIDTLIEEIQALQEKVDRLETRLEELESSPTPQVSPPMPITSAEPTTAAPVDERERRNWLDSMRRELRRSEALASGAWTNPETWDQVAEGMDREDVIELLGEPTRIRFSVRKDTDEILHYEGDLAGTGDAVAGEVRIYRGRVARFETPNFP